MLEKEFEVSCSISEIYLFLKRVGLHWISSRSRHPNQSQEVQDLFKNFVDIMADALSADVSFDDVNSGSKTKLW